MEETEQIQAEVESAAWETAVPAVVARPGLTLRQMVAASVEADAITQADRATCAAKGWGYPGRQNRRRRQG